MSPAATVSGLPYPLPSDPVHSGADDVRRLAEALDTRMSRAAYHWEAEAFDMAGGVWLSMPTGAVWPHVENDYPASATAGGTGQFVCPAAGFYLFGLGIGRANGSADWLVRIRNGARPLADGAASAVGGSSATTSAVSYCVAGDTILYDYYSNTAIAQGIQLLHGDQAAGMTDAIEHLFERIRAGYPAAVLGGIYANKPGYHNKRDALPPNDYSVIEPDDRAGSGANASALDVTLYAAADMARITKRLIALTDADEPRIQVLREFLGTVDGGSVTGRDVRGGYPISGDDSHLWHLHLSVYRKWADDRTALDAVADAILGAVTSVDDGDAAGDAAGGDPNSSSPWPGPQIGDPEMLFVRVVDESGAIYALAPGYKHHCTGEEWGAADAAGFEAPNVNRRQRDVLYAMLNSQKVQTAES